MQSSFRPCIFSSEKALIKFHVKKIGGLDSDNQVYGNVFEKSSILDKKGEICYNYGKSEIKRITECGNIPQREKLQVTQVSLI